MRKGIVRNLIGVTAISLAVLSVLYLPFQFTGQLYSLSFQYYKENYFSATASAEILNGVKNITVTEHEGNKTVNVTKTIIVESYFYFSASDEYSLPVKLIYVGLEGNTLLSKEINIGPYETITGYIKLGFNATGKSYSASFKFEDINGSTHTVTVSASVVNVSASSLSNIIDAVTFAFLIGNFSAKQNTTDRGVLTFSVLNTGPTAVILSKVCFEGAVVMDKPVVIEPFENYTNAVNITATITFLDNYTVSFVLNAGNATSEITETVTAY